MSTSETAARNDFERWIATTFEEEGSFTALDRARRDRRDERHSALFHFGQRHRSRRRLERSHRHVRRVRPGLARCGLLSAPGCPRAPPRQSHDTGCGCVNSNPRLDADRLVLNEGHFFDRWGRRMKVEELDAAMIVGTAGHIDHGKTSLVKAIYRRRCRPPEGGEGARHHDRRSASPIGRRRPQRDRFRRCAGT